MGSRAPPGDGARFFGQRRRGPSGGRADGGALSRPARPDGAALPRPAVALDGRGRLTYFVRKRNGTLWVGARPDAGAPWRDRQLSDGIAGDPAVTLDALHR